MIKQWIRNSSLYGFLKVVYSPVRIVRQWYGKRRQDKRMKIFYAQFVTENTLCFDLGANTGSRVNVFLQLGAHVVAVEPQPDCIQILQRLQHPHLHIVQAAVGSAEGQQEMVFAQPNIVSSLSGEFMTKLKDSGVCQGIQWGRSQPVPVTTLAILIEKFGLPGFIKVDVEGYEYEVLQGLSQPIPALSLEFHSLYLEPALQCITHLENLGKIQLNYTMFEDMRWQLEDWVPPAQMRQILEQYRSNHRLLAGDIYVRFSNLK